jgi:hypothetical protein
VTAIVLAHLAVNIVHGAAHAELHIGLSTIQQSFVLIVILICPLVAMALTWTAYRRAGAGLLALSMSGSLLFGVWNHFIQPGPDRVVGFGGLFGVTAALLAITEAAGIWIGMAVLRSTSAGSVAAAR